MKKIALVALAFAALTMPAAAQPAPAPPAQAAQASGLTVDSTMPELLGDPAARAVLERHLPDLVANPQVQSAPISLRALASYVPTLTEEKLNEINADLVAAGR